jgi:phenylalanine-4-hydroxylase
VDYDITKTQPQLFVVESFDQLSAVLDEVAESLAFCSGGLRGLNEAESSEELCTLTLDTGLQLIGQVSQVVAPQDAGAVLARVRGRTAFARAGSLVTRAAPAALPAELWLLVGRHADGAPLVGLSSAGNARTVPGNSCQLKLGGGLVLTAELLGEDALGSQSLFRCQEARLLWHGQLLASSPQVLLLLASEVTGARAGAVDPNYYDETEFSVLRAPKPRVFPPQERDMLVLYERALAAHHGSTEEMLSTFQELHERLMVQSPRDWLLRWNMLESLLKRKVEGPLSQALAQELTALERYYDAQEPIASGLGYLGFS